MSLFFDRFVPLKVIGEGSYGTAMLATDELCDRAVALKVIMKDSLKKVSHYNRLRREINILRLLDHPHIIKLYEVLENDSMIVLVSEYASGGDLFDIVSKKLKLSEMESRKYFRQIVSAVAYLHGSNLAHRDLKPENILLDENGNVKLIDFGFVHEITKGRLLQTFCGSYSYCAPEMLLGKPYDGVPSDIWSLGVILYVMLNGYFPFQSEDVRVLAKQITTADMRANEFASNDAIAFIKSMIVVDPANRLTIDQICKHGWILYGYQLTPSEEAPGTKAQLELKETLLKSLSLFESRSLKLEALAHQTLVIELPLASFSINDETLVSNSPSSRLSQVEPDDPKAKHQSSDIHSEPKDQNLDMSKTFSKKLSKLNWFAKKS